MTGFALKLGSSSPLLELLRRLGKALNLGPVDPIEAGGPGGLRRPRTPAALSAAGVTSNKEFESEVSTQAGKATTAR